MQFVCLLLRHKQQARKESEKAGSNGASDCDDWIVVFRRMSLRCGVSLSRILYLRRQMCWQNRHYTQLAHGRPIECAPFPWRCTLLCDVLCAYSMPRWGYLWTPTFATHRALHSGTHQSVVRHITAFNIILPARCRHTRNPANKSAWFSNCCLRGSKFKRPYDGDA